MKPSVIHAYDFDGVLCDSAVETALTGWRAAAQLWNDMPAHAPEAMVPLFRQVRPIIETGYEAILAMRLLYLGESVEAIYRHYPEKTAHLMQEAGVSIDALKTCFGETRDHWIAQDLADWIAMNPLFPGIAAKLQQLAQTAVWFIITTKQERFVKHILQANAIDLDDARIFGLDRNLSKAEVLKGLLQQYPEHAVEFVEDRLPTLIAVQQHPELAKVKLLFAEWGYNTDADKQAARERHFTPLKLAEFVL